MAWQIGTVLGVSLLIALLDDARSDVIGAFHNGWSLMADASLVAAVTYPFLHTRSSAPTTTGPAQQCEPYRRTPWSKGMALVMLTINDGPEATPDETTSSFLGRRTMPATKTRTRTFPTSIDLKTETREAMIDLCNQQLADSFDLYSQLKQAHWNVKGKDFSQLHKLFDDLAADVLEHVDLIAERATALGGYATGTARMAAATSALPEYPADAVDGPDHVRALVDRYAAYAASTRRAIETAMGVGDQSTADMFTEVSRQADKNLWFLEAHLQR